MRVTAELPASPDTAKKARTLIRARFANRLPAGTLQDLLTVVSELTANGARHGTGPTVGLAIALADGTVSGEVSSEGSGRVEARAPDLRGRGGLGLHIVDTLAERWRVESNGVTRVSFELRRS